MRAYVVCFILALVMTCAFNNEPASKSYVGVSVSNTVEKQQSAKQEAGNVGEINFVDIDRDHAMAASISDSDGGARIDLPQVGRFK